MKCRKSQQGLDVALAKLKDFKNSVRPWEKESYQYHRYSGFCVHIAVHNARSSGHHVLRRKLESLKYDCKRHFGELEETKFCLSHIKQ